MVWFIHIGVCVVVVVDVLTESGRATFSSSRARSVAAARAGRGEREGGLLSSTLSHFPPALDPLPVRLTLEAILALLRAKKSLCF